MQTYLKIHYQTTVNELVEKIWDVLTYPEMAKQYFFETELVTNGEVGSDIVSFDSLGA